MSLSKFFHDIYLHNHILHGGRVTPLTPSSHAQSIADKGFVDASKNYASTLIDDANISLHGINQIQSKAQLSAKTFTQIFDELFFAVKKYAYVAPVATIQLKVLDVLTSLELTSLIEVGQQIQISSTGSIAFNNSPGLIDTNPVVYTITSSGSTIVTTNHTTVDFTAAQYSARQNNLCTIDYKYKAATIQNDSHSIPDPIGNPAIFSAGQLSKTLSYNAYWAKFIGIHSSALPVLSNPTTIRSIFAASDIFTSKAITVDETSFVFDQFISSATPTRSIYFAIPNDANSSSRKISVRLNNEDITSLFTSTLLSDVQDAANSNTSTKDYTIYACQLDVAILSQYRLTINSFISI